MNRVKVSLFLISILFIVSCALISLCGTVHSRLDMNRESFMSYVKERSVLINVECRVTLPIPDSEREALGIPKVLHKSGSGTIVHSGSKGSYIVTAHHVVAGELFLECDSFTVVVSGGSKYKAVVSTKDVINDVAFIKIDKDMGISTPIATRSFVGQRVIVAGFPHIASVPNAIYSKESISITEGTVATHMFSSDGSLNVFRFTAPCFFGSSGGGVFDVHGGLLGVTSFLIGPKLGSETVPRDGNYFARSFGKVAGILPTK